MFSLRDVSQTDDRARAACTVCSARHNTIRCALYRNVINWASSWVKTVAGQFCRTRWPAIRPVRSLNNGKWFLAPLLITAEYCNATTTCRGPDGFGCGFFTRYAAIATDWWRTPVNVRLAFLPTAYELKYHLRSTTALVVPRRTRVCSNNRFLFRKLRNAAAVRFETTTAITVVSGLEDYCHGRLSGFAANGFDCVPSKQCALCMVVYP